MKDRILTAILVAFVFVAVVGLTLTVAEFTFDIFILIVMFIASLEVKKVFEKKLAKAITPIPIFAIFFAYAVYYILQNTSYSGLTASSDYALIGFFMVLLIAYLVGAIWVSFDKRLTNQNLYTTAFVLIYPIAILSFMLSINYISFSAYRASAILLLFLTTTFSDVFAFFVGIKFKGPKLAPKISPKKTISGAIGGLFGGMIAGLIVFFMSFSGWFEWLGLVHNINFALVHFLIIGILGSVFTQFGDLVASFVKRRADVKDYGKLLKGHGGVMDRVDGMMFNAFIINLYIMMLMV